MQISPGYDLSQDSTVYIDSPWQPSIGEHYSPAKINRIGLSIVANKKELQSIPEGLAIIDNPEELNCGIDAVMR